MKTVSSSERMPLISTAILHGPILVTQPYCAWLETCIATRQTTHARGPRIGWIAKKVLGQCTKQHSRELDENELLHLYTHLHQ